jgi:hypothetical protein
MIYMRHIEICSLTYIGLNYDLQLMLGSLSSGLLHLSVVDNLTGFSSRCTWLYITSPCASIISMMSHLQ